MLVHKLQVLLMIFYTVLSILFCNYMIVHLLQKLKSILLKNSISIKDSKYLHVGAPWNCCRLGTGKRWHAGLHGSLYLQEEKQIKNALQILSRSSDVGLHRLQTI